MQSIISWSYVSTATIPVRALPEFKSSCCKTAINPLKIFPAPKWTQVGFSFVKASIFQYQIWEVQSLHFPMPVFLLLRLYLTSSYIPPIFLCILSVFIFICIFIPVVFTLYLLFVPCLLFTLYFTVQSFIFPT